MINSSHNKKTNDEDHKFNNIDQNLTCPECHSDEIITDSARGESICSQCGLVLSEHAINPEHERRAFTSEERDKRTRTGAPLTNLSVDMGLTTIIDRPNPQNQRLVRAVKWQNRLPWSKRNILIATTEIKRIGGILELPQDVKESAAKVYKKAFHKKLLRGRSIKAMVAACIYFACRASKIPRTLQEILDQTTVDGREMRKAYRTLVKELNLKVPSLEPTMLVSKYSSELKLSNKVERRVIEILRMVKNKQFIAGKDPKGLCAAAIYLAAREMGEQRSQQEISKVIGITEVTLRSRAKVFKQYIASREASKKVDETRTTSP
ncbi:MAG: transcription initiation factor IIB [Promethearchaeota archaeon]